MNGQAWRLFKSKEEHDSGMERLLTLADSELIPGTDEFDEFELLSLLIGHYESSNYPMDKPDPIEAIKFRMDQQGLTQADMREYIGSASKVSEVLNYKRPLSLSMIKRLHNGLGIPADILIQDIQQLDWLPISVSSNQLVIGLSEMCKNLASLQQYETISDNFTEISSSSQQIDFISKTKEMNTKSYFKFLSSTSSEVVENYTDDGLLSA